MTEKELLEYLNKHRLRDIESYEPYESGDFISKIEPDLEPWLLERLDIMVKLGYIWSISTGTKWKSLPKITSPLIVNVFILDRRFSINVDNWDFKSVTISISSLVDPDITKKMIGRCRDSKVKKIDSLLLELGKETTVLDEIDAKIKEFGLENYD